MSEISHNKITNNNTSTSDVTDVIISPEDRFYINLSDFLELITRLLEKNRVQINPVVFVIARSYIEKIEKQNIIKMFIEGSLENGNCVWDNIAKEDTRFCIQYFIRYVNNLTNINIKKLIDDKDPEKLFSEIFSEDVDVKVFWSYMKSFVRIALNYIKTNSGELSSRVRKLLTEDMIKKYSEMFKKQNC